MTGRKRVRLGDQAVHTFSANGIFVEFESTVVAEEAEGVRKAPKRNYWCTCGHNKPFCTPRACQKHITDAHSEQRQQQANGGEAGGHGNEAGGPAGQEDVEEPVPLKTRFVDRLESEAAFLWQAEDDTSDEDPEERGSRMADLCTQPDSRQRRHWFACADQDLPPEETMTVRQWAQLKLTAFLKCRMTISAFNEFLKGSLDILSLPRDQSHPKTRACLKEVPLTKAACDAAIGAHPPERYEVHLCHQDGCRHWWRYGTPDDHEDGCTGDCDLCRCPRCKTPRFNDPEARRSGANICWFFHDVLEQFFLDKELCKAIVDSKVSKGAHLHSTKRYQDILQVAKDNGFDPARVCR